MSGNAGRDDSGQFESAVDDDAIIRYFMDGRPFHTAGEVAEMFDIDRSTAYRRLSNLEDDGRLEKVSLGSRTVVWWYTEGRNDGSDAAEADDPLFSAPSFTIDDPISEDEIDDVLYGETEG